GNCRSCGREEVQRRLNDLNTRSHTERKEREVETSGRARYGESMFCLLHRSEFLLEGAHLLAHRQPLAGDDALDSVRLFAPVIQITQWNAPISQADAPLFVRCRSLAHAHNRRAGRYRARDNPTASRKPSRRLKSALTLDPENRDKCLVE